MSGLSPRGDGDAVGVVPPAHRPAGRLGSGPALGPGAASIALAALLLSACSVLRPAPLPAAEPQALPTAQPGGAPVRARAGGVFVAERATPLTSDTRAFRPGDVLTVLLQETTQASKKADTSLGKQSSGSFEMGVRNIGSSGNVGMDRDFAGRAASSQQNALSGAITVVVSEVMPNGLLKVQGEKSLYLNQGEELIRVGGYVRPSDVDSDNRVSSQRIANARIAYAGQGDLANANTPGWLTRWFVNPLMPF
ncbi:MAG: flagellar basal body L-ring protein FlgH [Comamonadaceae bacterium]|nr:flagellar basal body L-ring protein FlgH [Comamonadaceae bacterium]